MSIFNKYSKETRNLLIGFEKEFRDRLISIENGIHTIAEKIDPAYPIKFLIIFTAGILTKLLALILMRSMEKT